MGIFCGNVCSHGVGPAQPSPCAFLGNCRRFRILPDMRRMQFCVSRHVPPVCKITWADVDKSLRVFLRDLFGSLPDSQLAPAHLASVSILRVSQRDRRRDCRLRTQLAGDLSPAPAAGRRTDRLTSPRHGPAESKRAGRFHAPGPAISTKNKHLLAICPIPARGFSDIITNEGTFLTHRSIA